MLIEWWSSNIWHGVFTFLTPPSVAQFISTLSHEVITIPPWGSSSLPLKRSELPGCWLVHRYYMMSCAICSLKNVKNTHGGVLLWLKLQAKACNFTKSNTPPWTFFTFFKLHIWYQLAQSITYITFAINIRNWTLNDS